MNAKQRIVVIGNGMVGQKFLEKLTAGDEEAYDITVFCEEPPPAYDTVHLSVCFSGQRPRDPSPGHVGTA